VILSMPRNAAFAIPGDIDQKTGGYIYEKSLLLALRAAGRRVDHIQLPAGFPLATAEDTATARAQLAAVPPGVPLILDGLVYGGIETAALAAARAPLIAMIHHPVGLETGLRPDIAHLLLAREAANLALAAHVVVPSPHTARILAADFGVEPARISIALPGFAPPDPVRDPVDPPLVLAVGLIAERKGHDVLLSALAEVANLRWQAQIVGGTHDAALLERLVAQRAALGLSARVTFRGRLEERDLAAIYRQATVFALATRYEGYGMVFGEALLHGLPIVTCDGGAVPETVPPGTGLIVPVGDASAFADALRAVLSDSALRTRLAAAATAAGHRLPTWSDTAAVMGAVLDAA
jgi:glycosyltransferase involved in cell wall biosynthesis